MADSELKLWEANPFADRVPIRSAKGFASHSFGWRTFVAIAVAIVCANAAGCGPSPPSSAGNSTPEAAAKTDNKPTVQPTSTAPVTKTTATSDPTSAAKKPRAGKPSDPYAVPSGGTRELLQYIEGLQSRRLDGNTVAEQREAYRRTQHALVAAYDRLLRSDIDPALRLQVTDMKLNSLSDLMRLAEPNAKETFRAFAREAIGQSQRVLLAAKDESLRVSATEMRLNALRVLSGEGDEAARQEFLQFAGERTTDSHPQLARTAMRLLMDFHLRDIERGKRTDAKPIVETMKKYLASGRGADTSGAALTVRDLAVAVYRLAQLEQLGLVADARVLHREIQSAFADSKNEELRAEAERQLAAIGTRLNLVGKPLSIEGKLTDGQPLDWNAYRGKVVVVDFWTSWGRQSEQDEVNQAKARVAPAQAGKEPQTQTEVELLSTFERLRRLHEKHHPQGLEVIGVNLEKVPGDINRFLSAEKPPWPTVANLPGSARGTVEPNAARCGVETPPMTVLIDRYGRVMKVGVLNERFEKRVAEALAQRSSPRVKAVPADPK